MKKFITLLLLCLTGMAAWAADIENVAFKNDVSMYLNAAVANDVVNVGTTAQSFSIKAVSGETNAYQLYNNDISRWINSGSNGYLSSASAQTNARYFYFYQVSQASNSLIMASPVATPEVGQKYVIVVKNTNSGYEGYYAVYGQLANGKTNRLDAIKLNNSLPQTLMLTGLTSSTGDFDYTKMVWSIEQLAAPEPPVDVTKTYYLKDTGISQYVVIPSTAGANVTSSATDKTAVKFAAVSGGYAIQDATSGNYIGISSWYAVSGTTAQPWAIAKVEGGITIKNTSGDYSGKWFGGQSGKTKFYNNNPSAIVFSLEEVASTTKECPQCSEAVDIDATTCPKCGYVFESDPAGGVTFPEAGTHYVTLANRDTGNHPYIYNALTESTYTLQSATAGTTNNFIWKVVSDGAGNITIVNGDGRGVGVNGQYKGRIDALKYKDLGGGYFYLTSDAIKAVKNDHECLNRSDGSYASNGIRTVTTWVGEGKTDNQWKVANVDMTGLKVYDVVVTGNAAGYATVGSEYAFDGGFFLAASISEGQVSAKAFEGYDFNVTVEGTTIKVEYTAPTVEYTVNITGATGSVTYGGNTYNNGEKITVAGLSETDLVATPLAGYTVSVEVNGTNINVTYTAINYSFETSPAPVGGVWQNGTKFYNIKEFRAGYLCANQLPNIKSQTTAPTTDDGKWAVIANGSYFQFMNKASKKVLTFASAANDALATTTDNLDDPYSLIDVVTYLNPSFEAGYECFKIANENAYPNDKDAGLAVWTSDQALWGWGYNASNPGSGDNGSKFLFTMVEELTNVTYTVSVEGAPAGETVTVTVKGETVVNNSITLSSTASPADVEATAISGYSYHVTIDTNTITVTYEEATPSAGTVYTIKALFPTQYTPVYLNYGGGNMTFPTSVQGVKSYWVARASGEERPWKFQSGYGDGSYLDGNSSTATSTTGAAYNVSETSYGFHMQTYVDGIAYPGLKYIGTWEAATHTVGHGKYGSAYGGSDSYGQWTTHYAIEAVPDVVVYDVVCANAQGGVTPTFANYAGVNVVRGGGIVIANKSLELSSTNLTAAAITGYTGTVSVSGRVITVTYEQSSEPIDVDYCFTVDGITIGSKTITEFRGEPSTVASIIPSYVEATGIPETVEEEVYIIDTNYTGLPFEIGKKYNVSIVGGGVEYWLYANASNAVVKESTTKGTSADYIWTVDGDWLNGFSFVNGVDYYMAAPSATPIDGANTAVTTTDGALTRFDLVQNGTYGYRYMPHGGSNYIAHTSKSSLNLGFFDYYGRDAVYNTGNTLLFEEYVAPIQITIGETGYATIAYTEDFVKPEGLKVYYCLDEGEEGHLTPVEWEKSYLPGYCAYIIEGTPGTYSFKITKDYEEDYPSEDYDVLGVLFYDNVLTGNFDDTDITVDEAKAFCGCDNIYVFSKKNDKMGFYTYVGSTLAAHKAFYAPDAASINGFTLDFGGQTVGVSSVISATNLKAGYDIQGRRINKVQKGINILNGKKIIK